MFCSACGTEIREGNLFCENCGKRAMLVQPTNNPQQTNNPQIKSKFNPQASVVEKTVTPWETQEENVDLKQKFDFVDCFKKVAIVATVILVLLGVIFVAGKISFARQKKEPIKMEVAEFVRIEIEGYSGRTNVNVDFDWEGFSARYTSEFERYRDVPLSEFFYDCGLDNYSLSKEYDIRNGDEVLYNCTADFEKAKEKYNVILDGTTIHYYVSYLEEGTEVDIFDYIYPQFSGSNGEGYAEVCWIECPYWAETFEFNIWPSSSLSNGDVVTVSLNISGETFKSLPEDYVLTSNQQEYEVYGLD